MPEKLEKTYKEKCVCSNRCYANIGAFLKKINSEEYRQENIRKWAKIIEERQCRKVAESEI